MAKGQHRLSKNHIVISNYLSSKLSSKPKVLVKVEGELRSEFPLEDVPVSFLDLDGTKYVNFKVSYGVKKGVGHFKHYKKKFYYLRKLAMRNEVDDSVGVKEEEINFGTISG